MRADKAAPAAGATALADIPTYKVDIRPLEKVVRATGTTQAERYASLLVPVLEGRRSGRGRDAQSSTAQVPGNASITVNSTSDDFAFLYCIAAQPDRHVVLERRHRKWRQCQAALRVGLRRMRAATSRVGNTSRTPAHQGTLGSSTGRHGTAASGQSSQTGQTRTPPETSRTLPSPHRRRWERRAQDLPRASSVAAPRARCDRRRGREAAEVVAVAAGLADGVRRLPSPYRNLFPAGRW